MSSRLEISSRLCTPMGVTSCRVIIGPRMLPTEPPAATKPNSRLLCSEE
jgi:hypothetical protein